MVKAKEKSKCPECDANIKESGYCPKCDGGDQESVPVEIEGLVLGHEDPFHH